MERLVSTMQDQIQILKKDLKEANEQIAAHKAAATPANALAAVPRSYRRSCSTASSRSRSRSPPLPGVQ